LDAQKSLSPKTVNKAASGSSGTKRAVGAALAVATLVIVSVMPRIEGLSHEGQLTVGLAIAFLLMLILEVLDLSVTCLIFLGLLYVFRVTPTFSEALSGFTNQVVFFVLASFGIAAAYTNIPLSKRILRMLLRKFGKNVRSMLFAIMLCSALVSSFVSNVPTCAIFMSIGLGFLLMYKQDDEKLRTAKAFMIGIPVASMIGGMMTPAGSSINLLALNLLEEYTGIRVSFVQWMGIGIPLTAVMLPLAWLLVVKVYKPAEINRDMVRDFIESLDVPDRMGRDEKKVLVVTGVMLTLWILSSWITVINVMVVAVLGCCAFFVPGIKVLNWKSFVTKDVSWDSFFLMGTVLSIGNAMVSRGVSEWLVTLIPADVAMSPLLLVALTAAIVFAALVIIPVAPALVTIMVTPLIALGAGWSPAALVLTLGFCAANCYLLPLDTVTLLTYGTGYYSMTDMMKSTGFLQIVMIALVAVWIPIACMLLGII
jgi:sodium-dependent dicarboxylate transporter 2/3/5